MRSPAVVAFALIGLACSRSGGGDSRDAAAGGGPAAIAKDAAPAAGAPPVTWYRVEVIADVSSSVPFFLGVYQALDRALIDNGDEQLEAVILDRDPLHVRVPVLAGEVTLAPEANGRFTGEWTAKTLLKDAYRVVATQVPNPSPRLRFPGDQAPAASIAGEWRIELNNFGIGRAVLRQDEAGNLTGSVIPPDVGDTRHLSGRVIGDRFAMSTFDGMHAHLFEGTIEEGGARLRGRWLATGFGEWELIGTRAKEPSGLSLVTTRLKKGKSRVSISALGQPPYKGQPVIVELFGTWCSACLDLVPELMKLEQRYADKGLKILPIALEPAGDEKEGKRRIEEFRKRYGVTWDIDVRFRKDVLSDVPKEIDNAMGFPMTIFVRRDGTVAGIHSAFISGAAGEDNAALRGRFEALAKEIVESPP